MVLQLQFTITMLQTCNLFASNSKLNINCTDTRCKDTSLTSNRYSLSDRRELLIEVDRGST